MKGKRFTTVSCCNYIFVLDSLSDSNDHNYFTYVRGFAQYCWAQASNKWDFLFPWFKVHILTVKIEISFLFFLDADLDKREPILRFITKKNPRNNHWGEMKLYLQSQVCLRVEEITLTSCYPLKEKSRCFAKQFPYKIASHRVKKNRNFGRSFFINIRVKICHSIE